MFLVWLGIGLWPGFDPMTDVPPARASHCSFARQQLEKGAVTKFVPPMLTASSICHALRSSCTERNSNFKFGWRKRQWWSCAIGSPRKRISWRKSKFCWRKKYICRRPKDCRSASSVVLKLISSRFPLGLNLHKFKIHCSLYCLLTSMRTVDLLSLRAQQTPAKTSQNQRTPAKTGFWILSCFVCHLTLLWLEWLLFGCGLDRT